MLCNTGNLNIRAILKQLSPMCQGCVREPNGDGM
jgi:hypothetical protein